MRSGWKDIPIGDACLVTDFVSNGSFASLRENVEYNYEKDYGILVRTTDFTKNWAKDFVYVPKAAFDFLKKSELREGDVVISNVGAPGVTFRVPDLGQPMTLGPNAILVRTNDENVIRQDYIYRFFESPVGQDMLKGITSGTTQMKFNKTNFRELKVPTPPPKEQQRIVGVLDAAFAALAEAQAHVERNRANARELFESYLNGVFEGKGEWITRPLHEFIHVKHGFAFLGEHFTSAGKHVLLTMGNFFEKGGYRDRGEKQKFYTGPVPEDFVLSKGDLVVAMTEQAAGLLGAPLLVPEAGKFLHNQRIGLVQQPKGPAVLNEFLFHIFNTKAFRDAVHASGSGVKVRHTSPTKIGEVEVSYPASLKEQQHIVDRLADLEQETLQLEATYQQKLTELAGLKKAVLGAAFRGEL